MGWEARCSMIDQPISSLQASDEDGLGQCEPAELVSGVQHKSVSLSQLDTKSSITTDRSMIGGPDAPPNSAVLFGPRTTAKDAEPDYHSAGAAEEVAWTGAWAQSASPSRPSSIDESLLKPRRLWEPEALLEPLPENLPFPTRSASCRPLAHHTRSHVEEDPSLKMIKQPETRPISQEQLVAEVKGIYAGLVMVESKCIEVCSSQDASPLNNEQWQALIAMHRTLLHEHHDFFLASQHPTASTTLRRLAGKYARPASARVRRSRNQISLIPRKLLETPDPIRDKMLGLLNIADYLMGMLDRRKLLLENAEGELLKWLEKTERLFERLYKRLIRLEYQLLIYTLLFFYAFFEFPNGIRHLCTTMPWTIWPALVVLWGVCWMFIAPHGKEKASPEYGTQPLIIPPEFDEDFHSSWVMYELSLLPPSSEPSFPAMPRDASQNISNHDYGRYGHSMDLNGCPPPSESLGFSNNAYSHSPTNIQSGSIQSSSLLQVGTGSTCAQLAAVLSVATLSDNLAVQGDGLSRDPAITVAEKSTIGPARSRQLECPDCGQKCSNRFTLKRHQKQHVGDNKKYFCPYKQCERSKPGSGFNRLDHLQRHVKAPCRFSTDSTDERHEFNASSTTEQIKSADEHLYPSDSNQGDITAEARQSSVGSSGSELLLNDEILLQLKRLHEIEVGRLEALENEIRQKRELMANLEATICSLEKAHQPTLE